MTRANDITDLILQEYPISNEMRNHFASRTRNHIDLVRYFCTKIAALDSRFANLSGSTHDASKYEEPELTPYIYISWQYKLKDAGLDYKMPDVIQGMMNKATEHHIKNNSHHPEYHFDGKIDLINRNDRDKIPDKIIDATSMDYLSIGEMVADWCAMSKEKSGNPIDWAYKNINKRWKFTDTQVDLIYYLINVAWDNEA